MLQVNHQKLLVDKQLWVSKFHSCRAYFYDNNIDPMYFFCYRIVIAAATYMISGQEAAPPSRTLSIFGACCCLPYLSSFVVLGVMSHGYLFLYPHVPMLCPILQVHFVSLPQSLNMNQSPSGAFFYNVDLSSYPYQGHHSILCWDLLGAHDDQSLVSTTVLEF